MKTTASKTSGNGVQKQTSGNGVQKQNVSKGVKTHSGAAEGLRELFENELKDIYWAEKALVKALPKMIKNATSQELINGITQHLEVTKNQVARLENIFELIGKKATAKKCAAMEGLITEASEIMEDTTEGVVRDAGIILAAQKAEHYEIATYGTLATFASILGENEVASLLEETLLEEKEADGALSQIAGQINIEAASEEEDDNVMVKTKSKKR